MPRGKILVADDEPDIVKAITMRLERSDYEVITASDGYNATQIATQEIPDLIILDIGMPVASGHEVVRYLQSTASTKDIPVIYLTARTSSEDYKQAVDEGVDTYITKPFKLTQVMNAVEDLLCGSEKKV